MHWLHRLRRLPALLLIAVYLALTAFYLGRHAVGDVVRHPFAYFWTWDMFPNYVTQSVRRTAIGETQSGEFIRLVPNDALRFRWGVHGDVTRLDIDRRLPFFRTAALTAARRHNAAAPGDRVQHIYLAERYWPQKFNLPRGLYRDFYRDEITGRIYWAGSTSDEDVPRRRYWRMIDETALADDGRAPAWETSP